MRVRRLALDDLEELLLQRLGDRPAAAASYFDPIDGADRRHLDAVPTRNTSSAI